MQEWRKYKLGDLIKINEETVEKNTEWINYIDISSVNAGFFDAPLKIKLSEAPSRAKRLLKDGDTVISSVRPYLKAYFYLKAPNPYTVASTGFAILSPKKIDPRFLYYVTTNDNYIQFLTNNCTGSAYPAFNPEVIEKSTVYIPDSVAAQHGIAEILGALDDKIELNLEINKTLEEMAMAIYKEWFVDFGPFRDGEFVDSELGPIPKGWEVMKIDEAIETLGGGTPKTSVKEYWENGEIIWYSPTDLTKTNSLFSLRSEKKITNLGLQKSSAKLFPPYSLLMTSRATIGAITINRYEACTNQGFITLVPNKQFTVYQLFGWLHQNMDTINNLANGSTFREISKGVFREFKILKAGDIDNYFKISKPIFDQIENNLIENNTLIETRDYLLPKLISGKIRVKAAEEKMKEVS